MGSTNPVLIGGGVVSNQSVYEVVTEARHIPGTQGVLDDGRRFEYVRSDNAATIPKGNLAVYEPMAAGSDDLTAVAAAIGATEIGVSVTLTLTANELQGGFLNVENDVGEGELYKIVSHPAHTSGAITFAIDRPVVVALTTASDVSIVHGPTSVHISTGVAAEALATEAAAGVPLVTVPIGSTTPQYSWIQKTGLASVLFGTAVGSVGDVLGYGEDSGSFAVSVEAESVAQIPQLGIIVSLLPVDTEYHVVRLSIE